MEIMTLCRRELFSFSLEILSCGLNLFLIALCMIAKRTTAGVFAGFERIAEPLNLLRLQAKGGGKVEQLGVALLEHFSQRRRRICSRAGLALSAQRDGGKQRERGDHAHRGGTKDTLS